MNVVQGGEIERDLEQLAESLRASTVAVRLRGDGAGSGVIWNADGAIVTKEGGGNADGDVALKLDALEDLGIQAIGLFAEMAGRDGTAPGLVVAPSRATALISTGNYDELVRLEATDRALGGERLGIVDAAATDELELPVAAIYGSLNPLGWNRVTCAAEA